jgi:hypothetical protein
LPIHFTKLGPKKKTLVVAMNALPPPPKQFEQLPQFGIDKDNFKN